jgi:hypothetical protein
MLAALVVAPLAAGAQSAVKVYSTDTVQAGCSLGALNATCEVEMAGKTSAGFVVTAVSSPTGITLVNESTRDGTNWDGHRFVDADGGTTLTSVPNASLAVGYGKGLVLGSGAKRVRVRVSAYTSGSATVTVRASDTPYPSIFPTYEVNDGAAQPTAVTTGEYRAPLVAPDGRQYVQLGGPVLWRCSVNAIAATLTQCQAAPAAGLSLYVSWLAWQSTTTTAGTGAIQSGTGTNCGTTTTAIFPASGTANRYGYPASSAAATTIFFPVPIKLTAAHALCVIGVATNTVRADLGGFTAP